MQVTIPQTTVTVPGPAALLRQWRWTLLAALVLAGDRHKAESVAAFLAASQTSYGRDPTKGFCASGGGTWPDDPPDIDGHRGCPIGTRETPGFASFGLWHGY